MKQYKPYQKGFTFFELILVIALLGILGIALVLFIPDYERSHLTLASKKVKGDIEMAQNLAMTNQGTTYGVVFADLQDRYVVYENTQATPVISPLTGQQLIEDFSDFSGVLITGGNFRVEFDKMGKPTTGGGGNVLLTDGSDTVTITVLEETGKVVISE